MSIWKDQTITPLNVEDNSDDVCSAGTGNSSIKESPWRLLDRLRVDMRRRRCEKTKQISPIYYHSNAESYGAVSSKLEITNSK